MCPSLIFSVGPFSVSICSVIGASPSILAPVFVLLSSFVDVVAAIFGGSCVCITQFICWCCCSYIRFKRLLGMEVPLKFAPLPRMQLQLTVLLSVGMVSFSYFYFGYPIGRKTASVMDLLQLCICAWTVTAYCMCNCQSWKKLKNQKSSILNSCCDMIVYHEAFQCYNCIYIAQNFCYLWSLGTGSWNIKLHNCGV